MISIKKKNNTTAAEASPSSSALVSSNNIKRRTSLCEKKLLLKNRIKEMKQRVFNKNKIFHENDKITQAIYADSKETTTTRRMSLLPRLKNYVEEATMNKRRKSLMNASGMTAASIEVIGEDFEYTNRLNFLSSTIIDDNNRAEDGVLNGAEILNSERNLDRLKKSLKKLKRFNKKRLSNASTVKDDNRRAYGCSGGEIFTSTSTNLRNLCHSTLTQNGDMSLQQQQHEQQKQQFMNLTKNINIYSDLNRIQSGFTDDAILYNKFNNFGEFKIWFV